MFTADTQAQGFDCNNVTEIPVIECEALVALYNSTNGPNWTDNAGWLVTNTPCSWDGITCIAGQVYLWLSDNQLSGSIPPELGNMTNLRHLRLAHNQLSGSIPPELGNMTNPTQLWLSDNQLSGSIPPELGNMTNLLLLELGSNQLSGLIPPELSRLNKLHTLSLPNNQISGSIPPELGNMVNLVKLHLFNNQLSGSIPPELGNMTNLLELWLNNNQLSGSIPPELGNLNDLQSLGLSDNELSGSIPPELGNVAAFLLRLENNQLSGDVPIAVLTQLIYCNLTNNPDLCIPDTPPYQVFGNPICGVYRGGPNCPVKISAQALLHGPYDGEGSMRTDLSPRPDFPLAQPFNSEPWNYTGPEIMASVPASVVDWVLLTLRQFKTVPSSEVGRRAALIQADGQIVDLDGMSPVEFYGVDDGLYYLWIQHRTHLGIMTASQLNVKYDTDAYNFSTGQDRALGTLPMVELEDGVFGLWGGDGNADGSVTATDFLNVWLPDNGGAGYLEADFNMDGQVTAFDFLTVWLVSNGQSSQVPN